MLINALILTATLMVAVLVWLPRLRASATWSAMTTPLASIIGSGFLVLGPILNVEYGLFAPLVMAGLCLGAYAFGAAIRFNMTTPPDVSGMAADRLEGAASWALSFAYFISVAYYLNLFGAFGVSLTPFDSPLAAKILTSAIYALILAVGWTRGFNSLERMEYVSVSVKLAIIAGLLTGLAAAFAGHLTAGTLVFNAPGQTGLSAITLAFGLIVTVQGFETSRYLGEAYDVPTRIRSMQWAQGLSTLIYMVYIVLLTFVFAKSDVALTETSIIGMMGTIAPVLPLLLVAAALAAQFSAAVADTSGAGGLIEELSARRLSARQAYLVLGVIGLALTWTTDVFEIISYASRAFAAYYALQSAIAALNARQRGAPGKAAAFAALAGFAVLVAVFGQAVQA